MAEWAYIATPEGASLGTTFKLALGDKYCFIEKGRDGKDKKSPFKIGIIRRSIKPEYDTELAALQPDDTIYLMYNLFMSNVIYPVGKFLLQPPRFTKYPEVMPYGNKYPAIGKMLDMNDQKQLEPDYVPQLKGTKETVLLGNLEFLSNQERCKIYTRDDGKANALVPWDTVREIKEKKERRTLLAQALLPERDSLRENTHNKLLGNEELDARTQQLIVESHIAEQGLVNKSNSFALAALPLCFACEYEAYRLLTYVARKRLIEKDDKSKFPVLRGAASDNKLNWIPDPQANEEITFANTIFALKNIPPEELGLRQSLLENIVGSKRDNEAGYLHKMKQWRNRLVHSYFIGNFRYKDDVDNIKELAYRILDITRQVNDDDSYLFGS